jgi:hypothetical protein
MAEAHKFRTKTRHKATALIKDAQDPGTEDLIGSSQALSPGQVLEMMLRNKMGQLVCFQTSKIQQPQRQRKAERDGSEIASLKLFMSCAKQSSAPKFGRPVGYDQHMAQCSKMLIFSRQFCMC